MLGAFDSGARGIVDHLRRAASVQAAPGARMVLADATEVDGTVCVLNGTVSSLTALAEAIDADPGGPPERVLAAALERLGPRLLGHLRGSFALALWSERHALGLVARDPVGALPLFLADWSGGVLFASEVSELLDVLPRRPAPDRAGLIDLLADLPCQSERTLFAGVRPLRAGHALVFDARGSRMHRYWEPAYEPPEPLGLREAAERFAVAARAAIGEDPRGGPRGILLSGGIDSCTVAAHAGPALPTPPGAYSLVFPDDPEIDESELIRAAAAHVGLASTRAAVRDGSPLGFALEFLDRWALPPVSMNGYAKVVLLRRAARDGVTVMLDGEGGDELFSLSPWLLADQLRARRLRAAGATVRRVPGAGTQTSRVLAQYALMRLGAATLPLGLLRRVRRPRSSWLPPPVPWMHSAPRAEALARENPLAWRTLPGPRWWAFLAFSLTRQREDTGHRDSLRREHAMAGLQGHHPLLDQDLTELVLALPPEIAFDPLTDRPLPRESVRDLLPDAVRLRQGKSYFDPPLRRLTDRHDVRVAARLLRDPDAEVRALVDLDAATRDLFDRGPGGHPRGPDFWLGDLWRLTMAEIWLRTQADGGYPRRLACESALPVVDIDWQIG